MIFKKCVCGGILLALSLGMYECNRCGQQCTDEPHLPHQDYGTNTNSFSNSAVYATTSSGIPSGNSYRLNFHENISVADDIKIEIS